MIKAALWINAENIMLGKKNLVTKRPHIYDATYIRSRVQKYIDRKTDTCRCSINTIVRVCNSSPGYFHTWSGWGGS